ncbi:pilus assembly protein PilM [bacterium]|nr:pilus assembly protein PilM [bacterium]
MAKHFLGIQISEYRIICIEAKVAGSVTVNKIAMASLPENSVVNGVIAEPTAVSEVLEAVITKMEITTDDAIINIPENLAQIKCIPTEQNYLNLTDDQLNWELSQHLNEPLQNLSTSYFILPMTTVLVAAKKEPVIIRAEIAEKIGLNILALDPEPIAMFNLLTVLEGSKPKRNLIVADIHIPYSYLIVFAKGEFWNGPAFFTPPEIFGIGDGKKTWREFTEDLITAFDITIHSYQRFNPAFNLDGIILSGRKLKDGIEQTIQSRLNVDIIDFAKILKKKTKLKPQKANIEPGEAVIALGLATHGKAFL